MIMDIIHATVTRNSEQLNILSRKLKHHFELQKFCDLTLTGKDNDCLKCHSSVLLSAPFFNDALSDSEEENIIDVSDYDIVVVKEAVGFLYGGSCIIDESNVTQLLEISNKWGINELQKECIKYMTKNHRIENAVEFYEACVKYHINGLKTELCFYIRNNFAIISKNKKFDDISLSNYCELIKHDEINVHEEDEILQILLDLLQNQQPMSLECFDLIRFEHLSPSYLFELTDHALLKEGPQKEYLKDAWAYLSQDGIKNPKKNPRSEIKRLTYINKNRFIYIYDREADLWTKRTKIPEWADMWTTVVSWGKQLAFVGADNNKQGCKDVAVINLEGNGSVIDLPPFEKGVDVPGVSFKNNEIYVIGGLQENDVSNHVNYISLADNKWMELPPLPTNSSQPVVIPHNNAIYVLGGWNGEPVMHCFKFDQLTSKWNCLKSLPSGTKCDNNNAGVLMYKNQILLVTNDKCLTYDSETDDWVEQKYADVGKVCNAVLYDEAIHCLIKKNDTNELMLYDYEHNSWISTGRNISDTLHNRYIFCIK